MDELPETPYAYLQWKGTDVCLDFQCECSPEDDWPEYHVDGCVSTGQLKCPRCGAVWQLGFYPTVTRVEEESYPTLLVPDEAAS